MKRYSNELPLNNKFLTFLRKLNYLFDTVVCNSVLYVDRTMFKTHDEIIELSTTLNELTHLTLYYNTSITTNRLE